MKIFDLSTDDYKDVQVMLLKMWCDNILKDTEYRRISDRVYKMKKEWEDVAAVQVER